jgi:hypothetical protein
VETSLAGGDSGSPAFVSDTGGALELVAVNNFVAAFQGGPTALSSFGTGFGGNLLHAYRDWIHSIQSRPANDSFARRAPLTGFAGSIAATSTGATRQPGEPAHAGVAGGHSVWWTWTAPAGGTVSMDTAGSGFDTLLAVYRGTVLESLTPAASNDDAPGTASSRVSFDVQSGETLQVAVDGAAGAAGDIRLAWRLEVPAAAGDNDIPLPPWALALLAGSLASLGIGAQRSR